MASATHLRPINMLPILEKIIDEVACEQPLEYVKYHKIKTKSSQDLGISTALQYVLDEWQENLDREFIIGAIFIHFQRPFEPIDREQLV